MTNSEIYYLAGKCLVMDENPEFKKVFIGLCNDNSIDWVQFVATCSDNLILPSIYLKFRSHGILEYLPKELNDHLAEIYELNKKRNNEILKQINSITTILKERNIIPIYLKGAGNLIDNLYSDIGERLMGDIDFLVPKKDYLIAAELMLNEGYLNWMDSTRINVRYSKHYPRIYHPNFISDVEIHRIPTKFKCESWFSSDIISAEKKTVKAPTDCYVQSDKHKIIHNFIHSQIDDNGFLYGKASLRDLYDLYLFSKRVSLINTLPWIKYKKKAIAYFAFTRHVFGFDKQFFSKQNFKFWILKKRHDSNFNPNLFYKINQKLVLGYIRFSNTYLGKLIDAFIYSREVRHSIIKKLGNPQFYKMFFDKLNFFR